MTMITQISESIMNGVVRLGVRRATSGATANPDAAGTGRPPWFALLPGRRGTPAPTGVTLVHGESHRNELRDQASPSGPPLLRRRPWLDAARNSSGIAALELAILAPFLFLLLFGIIYASVSFNNYLELNNGVRAAARAFMTGSGTTPVTNALATFKKSVPNLTYSNLTVTLKAGSVSCFSGTLSTAAAGDAACVTAFSANAGGDATVSATYPCKIPYLSLPLNSILFLATCNLNARVVERIGST